MDKLRVSIESVRDNPEFYAACSATVLKSVAEAQLVFLTKAEEEMKKNLVDSCNACKNYCGNCEEAKELPKTKAELAALRQHVREAKQKFDSAYDSAIDAMINPEKYPNTIGPSAVEQFLRDASEALRKAVE